jgi:hypothetical protein
MHSAIGKKLFSRTRPACIGNRRTGKINDRIGSLKTLHPDTWINAIPLNRLNQSPQQL